jgi:hypothetical protein
MACVGQSNYILEYGCAILNDNIAQWRIARIWSFIETVVKGPRTTRIRDKMATLSVELLLDLTLMKKTWFEVKILSTQAPEL